MDTCVPPKPSLSRKENDKCVIKKMIKKMMMKNKMKINEMNDEFQMKMEMMETM
jgi:hypothetical protein